MAVLAFHAAARKYHADHGARRLLLFACHPLLLPYWVLVYTDIASLLAVVVALACHVRRRAVLSAAALLAACLVRQSNVVWAVFFAAWAVMERLGWAAEGGRTELRTDPVARAGQPAVWPYLLAAIGGAVVLLGRGLTAPGSQVENRVGLNVGQVYVLFLSAALFWAPVWLADLGRYWRSRFLPALARPVGCAAVLAVIAGLTVAYRSDHDWNAQLDFARNWVLVALNRWPIGRGVAAAVIVAWAATRVYRAWGEPRRAVLALVGAFALLFVLPHYLVEPRYYIVPFVLADFFTTYTEKESRRLIVWYVLLGTVMGALMLGNAGGRGMLW